MAQSEFLKLQDKNGDQLIDECGDQPIVPEEPPCPDCKKDPYATTPNWKTRSDDEPWLNKKLCAYQVTITTSYTTAAASSSDSDSAANVYINKRFKEYADTAIESLIVNFNKKLDADSKKTVKESLEYTRFDLNVRAKSRLILLYSVPSYVIDALEEEDNSEDPEDPEEEFTGATVTYEPADSMSLKMLRIRKALHLYRRYYAVHRYQKGGTIVLDGTKIYNIEDYGDNGAWGDSLTSKILPGIDAFLNSKGLDIPKSSSGTRGGGFFKKKISKLNIKFNADYKIIRIEAFVGDCKEPQIFKGKKLKSLNKKGSVFLDKTAMAYFAQMDEMHRALVAREPMPWIEFILKFTKPLPEEMFNYRADENEDDPRALTCVADRLKEDAKQIGMDILDESFSIGDAIAYQFNKNVCKEDLDEVAEEEEELGLRPGFRARRKRFTNAVNTVQDPNNPENSQTMAAFAKEQAYKELQKDQLSFELLCAQMAGLAESGTISVQDMFATTFDRMKLCGFQVLLLDTMKCLMSGMTLDKALSALVQSALSAMSLENFGILFIGLPPDKQARLEELVKRNLASGKAFEEAAIPRHGLGDTSLTPEEEEEKARKERVAEAMADERAGASGGGGGTLGTAADIKARENSAIKNLVLRPWESAQAVAHDRKQRRNSPEDDQAEKRTLAQQFDLQNAKQELDTTRVMEAYIAALIEEYSDDLLFVIDMLNEFPGAPLIAGIIGSFDCPTSPVFEPTAMDFIKSVDLPFCRSPKDIQVPVLKNPFGWYPAKADFADALFEAVKVALQKALIKIMMEIMVKTCQIFGRAACKGLEVVGDLAMEKAAGGNTAFSDLVKDTICGPDADDEQVADTIQDIMTSLGPGAAALANTEEATNFTEDVASSTTQSEMTNALLGDCSESFLAIVDTIIEFDYPQYREGLPNREAICRFFTNVGNLAPPKVKQDMKDFADQLPENELVPANPSLCITDEQQQEFCELRQELLEGRATPEQIRRMCEDDQEDDASDLAELGAAAQGAPPALPSIVSQPGCDDGLIPFESEEAVSATTKTIANGLEQLKVQYVKDMLGHGGFGIFNSSDDWGMMNLLLSDTRGNALTVHNTKANRGIGPVMDYITNEKFTAADFFTLGFSMFVKPMPTIYQHSALPTKVASWMQDTLPDGWGNFESTNDWGPSSAEYYSFNELGFWGFFGQDVDLTELRTGYNTELIPHFGSTLSLGGAEVPPADSVEVLRLGRKATPDLSLAFQDNAKGETKQDNPSWEYGFDIGLYLSDLYEPSTLKYSALELQAGPRTRISTGPTIGAAPEASLQQFDKIVNVPNNNCRVVISDWENKNPPANIPIAAALMGPTALAAAAIATAAQNMLDDKPTIETKYEFFAVDDTLDNIKFSSYPKLLAAFQYQSDYPPQLILLQELIEQANDGTVITIETLKADYDQDNANIAAEVREMLEYNEDAFKFGASFETLSQSDFDYLDPDTGEEYNFDNDEKVLGVSRNQWNNEQNGTPEDTRVFYLDPNRKGYKGTYNNPPLYIKPLKNKGWMGFIDAIFPNFSECKNANTDFVDFGLIKERVQDTYDKIPEDMRMKQSAECAIELPYHRILERAAKSGIEALISATLQIFISTHFVKCMPMFSYLKPSFPQNYSNLYISYMVEALETALKDAQGPFAEAFNTFKDNEFWYAFLEQSVQLYGRLVDAGTIVDVPANIQGATTQLNNMQSVYEYPTKEDLVQAIKLGDEPWYQIFNLPGYRSEKNLEAVQATEDVAKLILGELFKREIEELSSKYADNLEMIGSPVVYEKLPYWFVSEACYTGGAGLNLKGKIIEDISDTDLETRTAPFYTNGGELYVDALKDPESTFKTGEDYVGYYHTHTDENGEKVFMMGKEHLLSPHDILAPYVNKVKMIDGDGNRIGDIADYGSIVSRVTLPFKIEKYISIDGRKLPPSAAVTEIKQNDDTTNLSEHYPGTLEIIYRDDEQKIPAGLKGHLGVRHGLELSYAVDTTYYTITNVEIDALDVSIADFTIAEPDSKLLLCLINKLIEDEKFRMLTEYIFPVNKFTALTAVYNDMALFLSIGQNIYEEPDNPEAESTGTYAAGFDTKPGLRFDSEGYALEIEGLGEEEPLPDPNGFVGGNDGWADYKKRKRWNWLPSRVEWDQWDQIILRKSKKTIKNMFKTYYYARDFKAGDPLLDESPSETSKRLLKNYFVPEPYGKQLVGVGKRKKLVPNPFGKSDKECRKTDE